MYLRQMPSHTSGAGQSTNGVVRFVVEAMHNVVTLLGAPHHSTMAEGHLPVLGGGTVAAHWLVRRCVVVLHVVRSHRVQLEGDPVGCRIETEMAVLPPWCCSPSDVKRGGLRIVIGNRVRRDD